MATYSKISKPATPTFTAIVKPHATSAARYGFGRFGVARYGQAEGQNPIAKPATPTYTKISRPA